MSSANRAVHRIIRSTFDEDLIRKAAEEAREQLGGRPSIVFAFVTGDWYPHMEEFCEVVRIYGQTGEVVGASTDGFIGTGEEDEEVSGCSLLFLHFPDTQIEIMEISPEEADIFTIPQRLREGSWITLVNPFRAHAEEWITQWNTATANQPTFGGLASGGGPEDVFLIHNGANDDDACLAINFQGGVRIQGVVSQGCRPIGDPYTITEVDDNVVVSIASRRALDVLEETFDNLGDEEKQTAQGNIFAGLAVSEYLEDYKRGDFLVRNILGGDPSAGILALGAFPRQGQTLQFQIRDKDTADEDLRILCATAMEESGSPFAGLLFSCTGRGSGMFGIPNHDAGVIQDTFGKIPLGGMFCNGEIGPVGGKNFVHGYTASTAFFYHL